MWVARGVILEVILRGARLGTAVHPAGSKAQCFPTLSQKASGHLCFGGGLIVPAGTGLGATRTWPPGLSGVSCGGEWLWGWRSLSPGELVAVMEGLGWSPVVPRWCHGG